MGVSSPYLMRLAAPVCTYTFPQKSHVSVLARVRRIIFGYRAIVPCLGGQLVAGRPVPVGPPKQEIAN